MIQNDNQYFPEEEDKTSQGLNVNKANSTYQQQGTNNIQYRIFKHTKDKKQIYKLEMNNSV